MDQNLEKIREEVRGELERHWLTLSADVRTKAQAMQRNTMGTPLNLDATELAAATEELCRHFEKTHHSVETLLGFLDPGSNPPPHSELQATSSEAQHQALIAQAKDHAENDSLKDVIKALFMWRDDPAEGK